MTTAARIKENGCDFPLFKTPLRNPLRTPGESNFQYNIKIRSNAFKNDK